MHEYLFALGRSGSAFQWLRCPAAETGPGAGGAERGLLLRSLSQHEP